MRDYQGQTKPLRILLVDDHAIVRDGIKRILGERRGGVLFGEASSESEAFRLIRQAAWDVVVLDISLGGRNALTTLQEIKRIKPKLPVLVLTIHPEKQYARQAFKLGASGYVTKGASRDEITEAVEKVLAGRRYVSPAFAESLVAGIERGVEGPPHAALSARELEVMSLLGLGKTVGEIAEMLSLSDRTVSTYRARVLEKMRMKTTAEIMRYVVETKLGK